MNIEAEEKLKNHFIHTYGNLWEVHYRALKVIPAHEAVVDLIAHFIGEANAQANVSGNEGNPSANKKDGEVAVCRHDGDKVYINAMTGKYRYCVKCGERC